ncbi:MAG: DUF1127 domain-containing protein [Xanthobacteraceae bacterium]
MELTQGVQPINANLFAVTGVLTNKVRAIFAAYANAKRERRNIRELRMLDDRTLADIGLTRGGIASFVREQARS